MKFYTYRLDEYQECIRMTFISIRRHRFCHFLSIW